MYQNMADVDAGASKSDSAGKSETTNHENYFVLPLVVDRLPAFGVLQLEGSVPLDENDLEFVTALADLLAISVDRFNKSEEVIERLSRSQADVLDLEAERELREKFVSLLTHDLRTPRGEWFTAD